MTWAAITGWGACVPPAILSNADLSTFLDTTDEWITTRTGMKERRVSHVPAIELASLGATNAAAMDLNTVCTSFLYGLAAATAMIRTSVSRNAVVIGTELISRYM